MVAPASRRRFTSRVGTPSGHVRVLVCDDDAVVREVVGAVLHDSGFAVVGEASNGAECLQLADWLKPDVLVIDHALVGMSGLETVRAARALLPGAAIVLLTAFDDALADAVGAGSDLGVDKADVADLGHRIHGLLAARAGGDAAAPR